MAEFSNSVLRRLAAAQRPSGREEDGAAGHPEPVLLSALAEGALLADEREGVVAHLAVCPECREVLSLAMAAAAEPEKQLAHAAPSFGSWLLRRKAIVATAFACLVVASVVVLHPWQRSNFHEQASAPASQRAVGEPVASPQPAKPPSASPAPAIVADEISPARNDRSAAKPAHVSPLPAPAMGVAEGSGAGTVGSLRVEAQAQPPLIQTPVSTRGAAGAAGGVVGGLASQPAALPSPPPPPPAAAAAQSVEVQNRALDTYSVQQNTNTIQQNANAPAASSAGNAFVSGTEANDQSLKLADQRDGNAPRAQSNAASVPESKTESAAGVVRSYESVNGTLVPSPAPVLPTAPRTQSSLARKALNKPLAIMRWSISAAGKLQRSINAGIWETVSVGAPVTFRAAAADAIGDHVWAGGEDATLYRSSDGGQSWSRVVPAVGSRTLSGDIISVRTVGPDAGIVRVRTSTGQNWVSNDQGINWQLEE